MNRRGLFVVAGGLGVALRPAVAVAQAAREADALTSALRLEHVSVFAYDAVVASGLLRGDELRMARRLRGHEASHAEAFAKALGDLGWPLPRPPDRLDQVEVPLVRSGLDSLAGRDDALALLSRLEALSLDVHRAALVRLRDGRFIQLAATVLAAEAQHEVAWRAVH